MVRVIIREGSPEEDGGKDLWNRYVQVLSREWNSEGVMDDESGESTEKDDVTDAERGESERLSNEPWGMRLTASIHVVIMEDWQKGIGLREL